MDIHQSTELTPGAHVEVNGERYYVRDPGGRRPAVVMLHGWPDDSTLWRHQQKALIDLGYRAIAVDWIGHGQSSAPADVLRYSAPALGRDVVQLLSTLDIGRAHLVAHDYGATISWETVANYPDRFLSFAAISVGHSLEILRDMLWGRLLHYRWLLLHGFERTFDTYLKNGAKRFWELFASHPDAARVLSRMQQVPRPTHFTIWERANPAYRVVPRLLANRRPVRVPTLGLYSRQDVFMTEGQMLRSRQRVQAPWSYFSIDGGHWVPLERHRVVTRILKDWLGQLQSEGNE